MGTTNILKATGVYPIVFLLLLIAIVYAACLRVWRNKNLNVRRQYQSLDRRLYYGAILRFMLEIDLRLVHQSFAVIWFIGTAQMAALGLHAAIALIMVILPLFILYFLVHNRDNLLDRERVIRFGTLYDNIKTDSLSTSLYSFFFLLRRMTLAAAVVFLFKKEYFKIQIFLWSQTIHLIYVGWTRPHIEASFNFLEKFNEFSLLLLGQMMFLMTHYMRDQEVKYEVGWLAIIVCAVLFTINFLVMVIVTMVMVMTSDLDFWSFSCMITITL